MNHLKGKIKIKYSSAKVNCSNCSNYCSNVLIKVKQIGWSPGRLRRKEKISVEDSCESEIASPIGHYCCYNQYL